MYKEQIEFGLIERGGYMIAICQKPDDIESRLELGSVAIGVYTRTPEFAKRYVELMKGALLDLIVEAAGVSKNDIKEEVVLDIDGVTNKQPGD